MCVQAGDRGVANLVFCIGGPYGHGMDVRSRANETMKLSDMVLNHQVSARWHIRVFVPAL